MERLLPAETCFTSIICYIYHTLTNPMKERVTYHKAFGIIMIACSVFILGVSFLIGFSLNSITGAVLLLVGILYLNSAAVVYDKEELELKNLYGMTMKRYNF